MIFKGYSIILQESLAFIFSSQRGILAHQLTIRPKELKQVEKISESIF